MGSQDSGGNPKLGVWVAASLEQRPGRTSAGELGARFLVNFRALMDPSDSDMASAVPSLKPKLVPLSTSKTRGVELSILLDLVLCRSVRPAISSLLFWGHPLIQKGLLLWWLK